MRRLGTLMGALLMAIGIAASLWQRVVDTDYTRLGQQVLGDQARDDEVAPLGISSYDTMDWNALSAQNPEIVAWVAVDNTSISLPVVAARPGDEEHCLTHDFWGRPAFEGTPFLDHRCNADDAHRLVFGHHLTTGGQFSDLQKAYLQEVFDMLGPCQWHTPKTGCTTLRPLCALRVDMWYERIQRFDFADDAYLRQWLGSLEDLASARSPDASALASQATSAVTLVTCSSDLARQPWRTLVVFVETDYCQS